MTMKISIDELYNQHSTLSEKDLLVDVREPEEYRMGRVPGSQNIPLGTVHNHADELQGYERVFVYCAHGRRSQMAAQILKELGLKNIVCVAGTGMAEWEQAGYPVEK